MQCGEIGRCSLVGTSFVTFSILEILPTFVYFLYGKLGELRSRSLGLKRVKAQMAWTVDYLLVVFQVSSGRLWGRFQLSLQTEEAYEEAH